MAENLPKNPSQRKLVKAVQAEFDRCRREIAPRLQQQGVTDPNMLTINAAQNSLRTCLEAVLNRMVPYDAKLIPELAIRLASYVISAAPMEDQEVYVAQFMSVFADAHMKRVAEGKVISSIWQMNDGRVQPNFPEEEG